MTAGLRAWQSAWDSVTSITMHFRHQLCRRFIAVLHHDGCLRTLPVDEAEPQVKAVAYARLSETYDAAESVPTQLDRSAAHAAGLGAGGGWCPAAIRAASPGPRSGR